MIFARKKQTPWLRSKTSLMTTDKIPDEQNSNSDLIANQHGEAVGNLDTPHNCCREMAFGCAPENDPWTWFTDVFIESDSDCGRGLLDVILEQLTASGCDEKHVFGIHLSMEEALVNAIKHGNKYNPEKRVHVIVGISSTLFRAQITDQGDGFDPNALPDPTSDEFFDRPNGRGVMLMRSFMTRVEFNTRGNSVILEKIL